MKDDMLETELYAVRYCNLRGKPAVRFYLTDREADDFADYLFRQGCVAIIHVSATRWEVAA